MSRVHQSVAVLLVGIMLLGALPFSASAEGAFSLDKAHKYLGFSTIGLAGATAATNGDKETHEALAYATAVLVSRVAS